MFPVSQSDTPAPVQKNFVLSVPKILGDPASLVPLSGPVRGLILDMYKVSDRQSALALVVLACRHLFNGFGCHEFPLLSVHDKLSLHLVELSYIRD